MNTALLQHAMVMPYFRSLYEQWNVSPLSACAKCAELQFDCFISCSSELTANSANSPPVYTRLNAAGVYSVWCKRVFGCRGMVFLKSATWFFFFLLAQWKPVREVNSNSGSLHIKGSSEEFQSISLKKKHFYFLLRCFPWSSSSHCWFSVTPVLHSYWSDLAGTILVHACVSQTGNKGTAVQQEEFSYVLAASIVMTWIFEGR